MFFGDEGGLGADFDGAAGAFANEGEEFDDVAELGGELDVEWGDFFDAADVDVFWVDEESVGEGAEEDGLVGSVPAVDVEGFVGFGISEFFGFLEGFGVAEAGLGHAHEDVIGGAVDDADDVLDAVSDEGVLNGLDDGDATGDGGLEVNGGVRFGGKGEKLGSALGEEGFVSGDDGLLGLEGSGYEIEGSGGAADEFDHDIDGRVGDDVHEIGGEEFIGCVDIARFGEVADGDFTDGEFDISLGSGGDEAAISLDDFPNAGANGSKAGEADS